MCIFAKKNQIRFVLFYVSNIVAVVFFAQMATAKHAIQLNIDDIIYECRPVSSDKPYKPDQVKRIADDQISFESRIDVACVKNIAGKSNFHPLETVLIQIENCRQRRPSISACQAVYSSPQTECIETAQGLLPSSVVRASQEKILSSCQRIAYHCPLPTAPPVDGPLKNLR